MPVTVVGSIAFDSVKTPFGERTRMLGGAAVHFALAASFFDDVRVVGPVGEDFGEAELDVLRRRGVDVSDIEHVAGGETFFWAGEYGWDLGSRETLDTRLGVFADFEPKLSASARDSMNLWIETARDSLIEAIATVDCLVPNDSELRELTAKPGLLGAAREVLAWGAPGPSVIIAKQGEYGAAMITDSSYFSLPAFPLET